jgi:DNA (cytosine-5)-methyltransferase 1
MEFHNEGKKRKTSTLPTQLNTLRAEMADEAAAHAAEIGPEICVGALETTVRLLQTVRLLLDSRGWRKEGSKVARGDGNRGVIALSSAGARAMRDHFAAADAAGGAVPPALAALLASGAVAWLDGWRGGSVAVLPPRPPGRAAPSFRYIELFAGIGGFRVALDGLNGQCVFASEICPHARATYAANSDDGMEPSGDITALEANDIPAHDLLTAGFPCQPFSRAGAQRGLADPRGALFYEVVRVARAKRPAALLLENVPNLLRVGNGHAMHSIVGALRAIGYTARAHVLNARAFGVPQHRERLFIAAFRAPDAARRFAWPTPRPPITLRSAAVLETLSPDALAKYRLSAAQWDIVRSSRGFAQWPRLAERGGVARTLRGSYRKSWSR